MSCSPLCQPIRFLAACTLESFCFFSGFILMFAVGMGHLLHSHGFPFMCIGEHVGYLKKYLCVRMRAFGGGYEKRDALHRESLLLLTI